MAKTVASLFNVSVVRIAAILKAAMSAKSIEGLLMLGLPIHQL